MVDLSRRPEGGSSRGLWALVLVLLAPAVVVPLLVPLYDSTDPTLFGFPFYFWAQLAMIPMAVALTVASYYLTKRAEQRDRANRVARRGVQR